MILRIFFIQNAFLYSLQGTPVLQSGFMEEFGGFANKQHQYRSY
jgi:hypothetical protein